MPGGPGEEMLVNASIVGPWQEFQRLPGLDDDLPALSMLPNRAFPKHVFNLRDLHFNSSSSNGSTLWQNLWTFILHRYQRKV